MSPTGGSCLTAEGDTRNPTNSFNAAADIWNGFPVNDLTNQNAKKSAITPHCGSHHGSTGWTGAHRHCLHLRQPVFRLGAKSVPERISLWSLNHLSNNALTFPWTHSNPALSHQHTPTPCPMPPPRSIFFPTIATRSTRRRSRSTSRRQRCVCSKWCREKFTYHGICLSSFANLCFPQRRAATRSTRSSRPNQTTVP